MPVKKQESAEIIEAIKPVVPEITEAPKPIETPTNVPEADKIVDFRLQKVGAYARFWYASGRQTRRLGQIRVEPIVWLDKEEEVPTELWTDVGDDLFIQPEGFVPVQKVTDNASKTEANAENTITEYGISTQSSDFDPEA